MAAPLWARCSQAMLVAACFGSASGSSHCGDHANCAGLDGECCPAPSGTMLSCCGSSAVKAQRAEELQQALNKHIGALVSCNVEDVILGYADDSVLAWYNKADPQKRVFCKGLDCVRTAYTALFKQLCSPQTNKINAVFIDNTSSTAGAQLGINMFTTSPNVVFTQWSVPDAGWQWATDVLVFDANYKISTHPMFYYGSMLELPARYRDQNITKGPDDAFYLRKWHEHDSGAVASCNLDGAFPSIKTCYADDAQISWVNHETGQAESFGIGWTIIKAAWTQLFSRICGDTPDGQKAEWIKLLPDVGSTTQVSIGNVATFGWIAPQSNNYIYEWAVDTIIFNTDGLIQTHVIYYKGHPTTTLSI